MNWQAVKAAPGQFVKLQVVVTEIKHLTGDYEYWNRAMSDALWHIIDVSAEALKEKQ